MKSKSMSNHPLRIALVYLVFSTAWIFITGYMVYSTGSETLEAFTAELLKGMLFVILSTILIYAVTRISLRWEKKSRALLEEVDHIFNYSPTVGAILANTTPITVMVVTENVNRFGYSRADVVQQPEFLKTLVFPDDFDGLSSDIHQNITDGRKEFSREFRIVTKTGEVRWILAHFSVDEKANNSEILISAVLTDLTENKQAEHEREEMLRKLATRERQLVDLINFYPDAILAIDKDENLVTWNRAMETLTGIKAEEVIGNPAASYAKIFYETERPLLLNYLLHPEMDIRVHHPNISIQGDIYESEITATFLGKKRFVSGRARPIYDDAGQIVGAIESIRDVTQARLEARQHQATEEILRRLFENAPQAILVFDSEGMVSMANAMAEKLFRQDRTEIHKLEFNSPKWHATHADGSPIAVDEYPYAIVKRTLKPFESDDISIRLAGQKNLARLSISAAPLFDEKHHFNGVIAILTDITHQYQERELLQQSNELLTATIESSPQAIFTLDVEGRVGLWNPSAESMLGWNHYEIIGKPIPLTSSESRSEFRELRERVLKGETVMGHETTWQKKSREPFSISLSAAPLHDLSGKINGMIAVVEDITLRKQAENEIQRFNRELEQRVEERTTQLQSVINELETFSYSVSHNLRGPLRHVNGFARALLEDYAPELDATGQDYLSRICVSADQMSRMVDALLTLAQITHAELHIEDVNISNLAEEALDQQQDLEPKRRVTSSVVPHMHTKGDPAMLSIVLQNLINSAWTSTRANPQAQIEVGCITNADGQTVYTIHDNGSGFDLPDSAQLFEAIQRFYREEGADNTSINLATVSKILQRHNGKVWAESAPGEGTTFFFTVNL